MCGQEGDGSGGPTGRIGSWRQLAENVWLVSPGCSGGAQWYCRNHLLLVQPWLQGKPLVARENGRFSLYAYACGNGVNLPHVANHAFGDQMSLNVQKTMPFGSPLHKGSKNCGLSQKKNIF